MSSLTIFMLCFLAFIAQVFSHNVFIRPPQTIDEDDWSDLPEYKVGDSINIQWVSDFEYQGLILWQEYPRQSKTEWINETLLADSRSTSKIYTVNLDNFDDNVPNGQWAVFKLALYNASELTYDCSSYFNVTVAGKTHPSGSGTAATATVTVFESAPNSDISNGAVAGITVGATLGGLALLAGIGFFISRHMRKSNDAGYTETLQIPPIEEYKSDLLVVSPTELQGARPELATEYPINPLGHHPYSQGPGYLYEAP